MNLSCLTITGMLTTHLFTICLLDKTQKYEKSGFSIPAGGPLKQEVMHLSNVQAPKSTTGQRVTMSSGDGGVVFTPLCQGFLKKRKDKMVSDSFYY